MRKFIRCTMCTDAYTLADIAEWHKNYSPYLDEVEYFVCPECYHDLSSGETEFGKVFRAIFKAGQNYRRWPYEDR